MQEPQISSSPSSTPTLSASPSPSPSPPLQQVTVNEWTVKPRQYKAINHRLKYAITGQYPFIAWRGDRSVRLNQEIQSKISRHYAYAMHPSPKEFRDHLRAFPKEDPLETAEFSYEILFARNYLLSIRFHDMTYSYGAAHPLENYFSLNFDLKRRVVVPISSLFRPSAHFMPRLVDLCQSGLDEGGAFTFPDAVRTELHRHIEWNITRKRLVINFDRCAVSACADGERSVTIPYDQFERLLNRKGILGRVLTD